MIRFLFPKEVEENLPIEISKKIRPLILTNFMLPIYFVLAGFLRYVNDPERSGLFLVFLLSTTIFFILSLILIKWRMFQSASYLSSAGLLLNILWTGLFLPITENSDLYRFALYVGASSIANGMISLGRFQIIVYMVMSLVVYFLGTFLNYVPSLGGFQGELMRNFLTTLVLIFAINYIIFLIDRTNKGLIDELKDYNETLEDRVRQRTQELVEANLKLFQRQEEIEKNLRLAKRIQHNILPNERTYPQRKELNFSSTYKSLDTVGGDFFDVIQVGRNSFGILIADVSGHGVPAAMVTTMAKVSFNTHAGFGIEPGKICEKVNLDILRLLGEDRSHYLTAYLGILNLETGTFSFTNAGHHPALLIHPKKEKLQQLGHPNAFIGFFENVCFETENIQLEQGDRIILYTDGLVEAMNNKDELYDHPRLLQFMYKNRDQPLKLLVEGLIQDVQNFCDGRQPLDDQAVLAVEYLGPDKINVEEAHAQTPQQDWKALIKLAVEHARANRLVEAEELLSSIYSKWMDKPEVAHLYASLLHKIGKIKSAKRVVDNALTHFPNHSDLLELKKKLV